MKKKEKKECLLYFGEAPTETQGVNQKLVYLKKGNNEVAIVSDPFENKFHLFPDKEEIKKHFEKNSLTPMKNPPKTIRKIMDKLFKKAEKYGDSEETEKAIIKLMNQLRVL